MVAVACLLLFVQCAGHAKLSDDIEALKQKLEEAKEATRDELGPQIIDASAVTRDELGRQIINTNTATRDELGRQIIDTNTATRDELGRQIINTNTATRDELERQIIDTNTATRDELGRQIINANTATHDELGRQIIDTNTATRDELERQIIEVQMEAHNNLSQEIKFNLRESSEFSASVVPILKYLFGNEKKRVGLHTEETEEEILMDDMDDLDEKMALLEKSVQVAAEMGLHEHNPGKKIPLSNIIISSNASADSPPSLLAE